MSIASDAEKCITLPGAAFTADSPAEAAARLLDCLARSTPGAFAGWVCIAEKSPAALRPLAGYGQGREVRLGGDLREISERPSAEDLRLLYRAFCEQTSV